ncbi:MAG: hypothetical protein HC830_03685 [Bacteroidetes bacterium]|nr:hypothetical protein [Bacteroidota bacterium]
MIVGQYNFFTNYQAHKSRFVCLIYTGNSQSCREDELNGKLQSIVIMESETGTGKAELETLVSVLAKLEKEGYTTQYKADENGLHSTATGKIYSPENITVESFYRFEGESDPEDNSIVYAIKTNDGEKGTLTDGYSNSSDEHVSAFMKQVNDIQKGELNQAFKE